MEYHIPKTWSGPRTKLAVLAILTLVTVILTVFSLSNNIQILFTHIYYIPIIIAALWFDRKGIYYTLFLCTFYLSAVWLLTSHDTETLIAAIGRVIAFVGISVVCAILSVRIKMQQEQIANSESRFRGIWESIQAAIILVDPETHAIIAANPEAEKLTGYSEQEMVGHVCHNFVCPADKGKCPISDQGLKMHRAERILLSRDGTAIPVLKTVTEIEIGKKRYFIENFIDIRQIKDA